MKYKLLAVSSEAVINIGDYIQALAALQFLPTNDGFIQRESLRTYQGEDATVIMNGWFMHHPNQWPPAKSIHPIFLAFHLNVLAQEHVLSQEGIAYLKEHEPIGCRDYYTVNLLKAKGINAFFSGCLTLTLGEHFRFEGKREGIIFVDPFFVTKWSFSSGMKNLATLFVHWKAIKAIAKKHPDGRGGRRMMILATFYREYRKLFSKEALIHGEYICQQSSHYKKAFQTDEERLMEAKRLVKKYAQAKLVITSRIHCALPCLGLETPVIYTEDESQSEASKCRMSGLKELFNVLLWRGGHLEPQFRTKENSYLDKIIPANKDHWREIAMNIGSTVREKLYPQSSTTRNSSYNVPCSAHVEKPQQITSEKNGIHCK